MAKQSPKFEKTYFEQKEVCVLLGISLDTLFKMRLPFRRVYPGSKKQFISKADIDAYYARMPLVTPEFNPAEA